MCVMDYKAPVAEQRFVLDHVAGIAELAAHDAFAAASSDMVDAIIDGAARFAEGESALLNRSGDIQGAKRNGGEVPMNDGLEQQSCVLGEGMTVSEKIGG